MWLKIDIQCIMNLISPNQMTRAFLEGIQSTAPHLNHYKTHATHNTRHTHTRHNARHTHTQHTQHATQRTTYTHTTHNTHVQKEKERERERARTRKREKERKREREQARESERTLKKHLMRAVLNRISLLIVIDICIESKSILSCGIKQPITELCRIFSATADPSKGSWRFYITINFLFCYSRTQ